MKKHQKLYCPFLPTGTHIIKKKYLHEIVVSEQQILLSKTCLTSDLQCKKMYIKTFILRNSASRTNMFINKVFFISKIYTCMSLGI